MNVKSGKNPPEEINVYVEIPQDGSIKYELDKDSGVIFVDRFLFTAFSYPFNYGFIPNSHAKDGDPIDVLVLSSKSVAPGCVIPAKTIGMLQMEDEAGIDTKILAVPSQKIDPFYGSWKDINDVPQAVKDKIKHFFEHYKELEPGKWVKVREFLGKKEALADIREGLK
jgi:inorganic pyrophosphatase